MRCKNCGWPNKPEASTCSKCGSPLESSQPLGQFTDSNSELKKTIREDDAFGNQLAQPNICPKCSYPLRPGTTKCPNCQTELNGGTPNQNQQEVRRQAPRRPTVLNAPKFNGTVNVWTEGGIGVSPSFILSPVKRNGERHDPGNISITSRTQAVITRKDDQWYIEDKSEQKTTFVQANTPQPLKDYSSRKSFVCVPRIESQ